jgi:adenylate kinase family enzyme
LLSSRSRICVVGTSGSGKTTVARAIASRLDVRYLDNDAMIWRPGWTPTPKDELYRELDLLTRDDGWVFDGNLGSDAADQLVLARADAFVWLDLPRWRVHGQIVARSFARAWSGRPAWHDNVETWRQLVSRDSIVWWSVKTYARRKRQYGALFADPRYAHCERVRLCSRRAIDRWLALLR